MANLRQERHVELVTGLQEQFVITSQLTAANIPSELPQLAIFVLSIVTREDPKDDTFSRVGRVSDLTTLPVGRDAGLASAGGTNIEYLSAGATLIYTTLNDAVLASTTIRDRVSALVTSWNQFYTQFNAPDPTPIDYLIPSIDPSQVAALIGAYRVAKHSAYSAFAAKQAADTQFTFATTDLASKSTRLASAKSVQSYALIVTSESGTINTAFTTLLTASDTYYAFKNTSSGPDMTFSGVLSSAHATVASSAPYPGDSANLVSYANTLVTMLQSENDIATLALYAATSSQTIAGNTLTAATATMNTALNAVLAVCPTFDKTSVCWIDDDGSISF